MAFCGLFSTSLIHQGIPVARCGSRWIHRLRVLSCQCRVYSTNDQQRIHFLRTDVSLIPQFGINSCIDNGKIRSQRIRSVLIDKNGPKSSDQLITFSYQLYQRISDVLKDKVSAEKNPRIAILCENDMTYVIAQLAIWLYCGVGVPLCKTHPASEWKYVLDDAQCSAVIKSIQVDLPALGNIEVIDMGQASEYVKITSKPYALVEKVAHVDDPALIIYTSGTTGPPKGVVLTHRNLITNMNDMMKEWKWNSTWEGKNKEIILHCLPLHHVHGVVNALWTPLFCGASVYMIPKFDAGLVMKLLANSCFDEFTEEEDSLRSKYAADITVFMGVPTMYAKLIHYYEELNESFTESPADLLMKHNITKELSKIRLMVSGSAALPITIMEKWHKISGHWLLERYGMTEVGMALTNPLDGERIPGTVGVPFPSVKVKISQTDVYTKEGYTTLCEGDHSGTEVKPGVKEVVGELLIKGPAVFKEYWNRPQAAKKTFTKDGWFKTGDTAEYKDGVYRILGRTSVDIIKSGGYKISALDIERTLSTHPFIVDCAVIGLEDLVWGQKVAAAVVLDSPKTILTEKDLHLWAKDKLPSYKIPSVVKVMDQIPRNTMGKVNKKELAAREFKKF